MISQEISSVANRPAKSLFSIRDLVDCREDKDTSTRSGELLLCIKYKYGKFENDV